MVWHCQHPLLVGSLGMMSEGVGSYTRGNWLRITCDMQSTPSVLEVVKKKKN